MRRHFVLLAFAIVASGLVAPARAADVIDFQRDIRPILADNCFKCHGSDAGAIPLDRAKVLKEYESILNMQGDVERGAKIFTKTCAICHQYQGMGPSVGPELASVKDKTPEGLLIAILDPNRAVEPRYINYVATTKTGQTLTGLIANETSTSITLLGADGKKHELLRSNIDELTSSGKSLMPEGLEKDIPPQDLADVIAYVRALGMTGKGARSAR